MGFQIKEGIRWVGKIDWELRRFHGEEYSTHRGSSYNSYLVTDQKTVLIDTVWAKYADEFVENLRRRRRSISSLPTMPNPITAAHCRN